VRQFIRNEFGVKVFWVYNNALLSLQRKTIKDIWFRHLLFSYSNEFKSFFSYGSMAPAIESVLRVHISPIDWPDKIVEFRHCYEEVISKGSNDQRYLNGLRAIVGHLLEPIGHEFCEVMEKKGYSVEKLGNMAAFNILDGEAVHFSGIYLEDKTHKLLRDLYVAQPNEEDLDAGLRDFLDLLAKAPNSQEIKGLKSVCHRYLQGNEAGAFGVVKNILASMQGKEYSNNFETATWGSCYYLENSNLGFPFVLLLPAIMYVAPCKKSAGEGDKGLGVLLETKVQYEQPDLIDPEELLKKAKNMDPFHLPPIVGCLPDKTYFEKLALDIPSDAYHVSHSQIPSDHGQDTLWSGNMFIPAPQVIPPAKQSRRTKRKSKKQKTILPTLESFTD
jgi:hypothetical protein